MRNFISNVLLVVGIPLFIFGLYLAQLRVSPTKLAFAETPETNISNQTELTPSFLEIPSINARVQVIPTMISENEWRTSHIGVSYLSSTPIPGDQGNSVFYGHNWAGILKDLPKVKPGDEILITMSNGEIKKFEVETTGVVEPDSTEVIKPTQDSRITIYTCTGFLDLKRFVVVTK